MKKRCNIYLTKPSNVTFRDGKMTLHSNIKEIDLDLDKIHELITEGQIVTQILNDHTEERLTLDNYTDDYLFEAVLERREKISKMRNDFQEYAKTSNEELQRKRSSLSKEEFKAQMKQMYDELKRRNDEIVSVIEELESHTRGVPYDESEDENIV